MLVASVYLTFQVGFPFQLHLCTLPSILTASVFLAFQVGFHANCTCVPFRYVFHVNFICVPYLSSKVSMLTAPVYLTFHVNCTCVPYLSSKVSMLTAPVYLTFQVGFHVNFIWVPYLSGKVSMLGFGTTFHVRPTSDYISCHTRSQDFYILLLQRLHSAWIFLSLY